MLSRIATSVDSLVRMVGFTAFIIYPALILTMLYEVIARYAFNAPTVWAFDITFMLHGALFMLTGGYALQRNAHVRIDVLSTRLPVPIQHAANLLTYALFFLPAIWIFGNAAIRRSKSAFFTDEVEIVSSWGPPVWPFFTALSLGLVILWLQAFTEAVRHLIGVFTGRPLKLPEAKT